MVIASTGRRDRSDATRRDATLVAGGLLLGLSLPSGRPLSTIRWALCKTRSQMASAFVGTPMWSCHLVVSIRTSADALIKAGLLLEHESDPAKQDALSRVVQESTSHLSAAVDEFLDACVRGKQVSRTEPGENPHLREAFAPLLSLRGPAQGPEAALHKANLTLTRIGEVLHDAGNYVRLSMGLDRVENAPAAEHD